jgi:uncharacterized protein (TIGR00288 family)
MTLAYGRQPIPEEYSVSFESEHALAVLVDIENLARPGARTRDDFDIHLVLNLLAEKGRVVVKRAYADWSRYRDARRELMNAGLELIEMPSAREGAKNRADIKMAVDAMEIAYSRAHVTNFVIVSGDSDFTPLVGKLRELNKRVIGIGRDDHSSSALLIANCDEFYFYDNIASKAVRHHVEGQRPDALSLLRETLEARGREGDEHPQASAVKDSMRRRDPAFSEGDIGFSTFSKFLEDAQAKGIVRLVTDPRSGTYLVELTDGSGGTASASTSSSASEDGGRESSPDARRRRRRRRGGESSDNGSREAEVAEVEVVEDGAEVFEFKVPVREPEVRETEMPPLDQPLSYEDLLPEAEAAVETTEAPPTRGARRRRKPLSTVPEPDTADLEDAPEVEAEAPSAAPAEETPRPGRRRRTSSSSRTETAAEPASSAEPVSAPAPVAASDDAEAAAASAPTSRRRVRRGSVLATPASSDEAAAETTTAAAPAEDDKPKRRTRTSAKKADEPVAEVAAPTDESADAEKPKRRTRTSVKKADEPVAEAAADAPAEAEAEKPKRRTRTSAKKADEPVADAAVSADAPAEGEKPKRRTRTKKAADPSDEGIGASESPY